MITSISLSYFRNHARLHLDVDAAMVAIIGANGAGKTNVLEALSLFAPGRGMRSADSNDWMKEGANHGFAVRVQSKGGALATGMQPGDNRRTVTLDDKVIAQQDLFGHLRIMWLSPEDDFVLGNGARMRRDFLDRLITALDPSHMGRVMQLQKHHSERRKILAMPRPDSIWLKRVEQSIAERGTAIAAGRVHFAQILHPIIQQLPLNLPPVSCSVIGEIEKHLGHHPALATEDFYASELQKSRAADVARGQTQFGVHRSDWAIHHLGKSQPVDRCSTGEQKLMLFTIFLAAATIVKEQFSPPILLLDECLSHLDKNNRDAILDYMQSLGCQVFWTGTDMPAVRGQQKIITLGSTPSAVAQKIS